VPERGLGHVERAGQVDGEDLVPVSRGQVQGELVDRDAGVVDEDVEPTVLIDHFPHHPPAVLGLGDIPLVNREPHRSTETALEIGGEGLGAFGVAAVSGGQDGPSLARLVQIAAPIPRVPPVTNATRPASFRPMTPGAWSAMSSVEVIANSLTKRGQKPGTGHAGLGPAS